MIILPPLRCTIWSASDEISTDAPPPSMLMTLPSMVTVEPACGLTVITACAEAAVLLNSHISNEVKKITGVINKFFIVIAFWLIY